MSPPRLPSAPVPRAPRHPATSRPLLALLALVGLIGPGALAAEPELRPEDLPHFPALEPDQALQSFEVVPGFRLEIAAAEPQVVDPVAFTFDERGRIYVIEMRDYSERRPERLGRVRLLEDRDADGRYETSTVFLDGLPWPTAITCWDGGVFVGSTPDILYARDQDGDGRADVRETIFTGFANDYAPYATNKLNVQALLNSFHWGVDARLHGSSSMSGGKVSLVDSAFTRAWRTRGGVSATSAPPAVLDVRGRDFSFHPHTLELRAETGGGQHGMSFDDFGRKYLCSNSDHLQIARFADRYAGGSPWYPMPSPRASIAVDGAAAPVFRISPEEPWRVIRTRWRVTGLVQGLIEGGGRSSGYFTSATGLTIFRGDAYGPDSVGDAFVADCGSNLIHRKKLRAHGVEWSGERPPSERDREFIASRDTWFRPVQFANAPDGCLWFADMYREVIEHPWSLPPNLKRLIDLNSGNDRGRLYRIAPATGDLRRRTDLAALPPQEWVALLSHANGWHRDTAARLIAQSRSPALIAPLRAAAREASSAQGRVHALHSLGILGALDPDTLLAALADAAPEVRTHAVRLLEEHLGNSPIEPGSPLTAALRNLATGPAEPRLQLALSLRTLRVPQRAHLLADLLVASREDAGEGLIVDAALASAEDEIAPLFQSFADRLRTLDSADDWPQGGAFPRLAAALGKRNRAEELQAAIAALATLKPGALTLRTAAQLASGLAASGSSLAQTPAPTQWSALRNHAARLLQPANSPAATTRDAVRLLADLDPASARTPLLSLLAKDRPTAHQAAALEALARINARQAWSDALGQWPALHPESRLLALDLTARQAFGPGLILEALAAQRIAAGDLGTTHVTSLRNHSDAATRARARTLLGEPPANRADAIAAALPALSLRGDAGRAQAVFAAQCATCHRLGGQGHPLGPDLESVRSQPKEKLLVAIVDPNREVQPAYLTTTLETTDGESVTGLAASEASDPVVLRQAGGLTASVARAKIRSLHPDGRSLMPEGFESTLTHQQLADVLALLTGTP